MLNLRGNSGPRSRFAATAAWVLTIRHWYSRRLHVTLAGMDQLLKYRGEFPILDRTTYLISNSLGAMPRGVYHSLHTYADAWAERGVRAWEEGWWEMAVDVGDKIAPLIGARERS